VRTQARRCFLHSLIAVSIMFCSRIQPAASWVPKRRLTDSLLHDTTNLVCKRTEVSAVWGHRSGEMKFIDVFCSFQRIFRLFLFFLQVVQKQTLGKMGNWTIIWWPVLSEILVPKNIKIWPSLFKLQSIMSGMFFLCFLLMSTHISCVPPSPGSAEAHIGWGGNVNSRLMASCAGNICTSNY